MPLMVTMEPVSVLQIVFSLTCIVVSSHLSLCAESPIVEIQQGKLQGVVLTFPHSHKGYFAFTGIPYAKAPIGNLRFKVRSRISFAFSLILACYI